MAEQEPRETRPRDVDPINCQKCDMPARLVASVPDSRQGDRVVRMYRCPQCDALIWVD
jgi:hypothetical protein